jgi:hypothetical protein
MRPPSSIARLSAAALLVTASAAVFLAPIPTSAQSPARPAAQPAGTVSLTPKWTIGDTQHFEFRFESIRSAGNSAKADERVSQTFVQEGRITRRVIAVDNGIPTLSFVYDRVKAEVSAVKNSLAFDSSKPAAEDGDNSLAKSMRPVIGRSITVKLDAKGDIDTITGNEQPKPSTDANAPKPQLLSDALIGQDVFRRLLRPTYALEGAPASAAPGATWKLAQDTPQPPVGVLTSNKVFTLKSVNNNMAAIDMKGDVELAPAVGTQAVKAAISAHKIEGTIEWDTLAGVLKSYTTTNNVVIEGDDYAGQKRTLDSTTNIRITRVAAENK